MSTIYEMKHVKNLTNFEKLVSLVSNYGKAYNPPKPALQLDSLKAIAVNAHAAITNLNEIFQVYNNAVTMREIAFEPLNKLRARFLSLLKTTDVKSKTVLEYNSQAHYESTLESLSEQIKFLKTIPLEIPNHTDLQTATLQILYDDLQAKHQMAINQSLLFNNARLICNEVMYHKEFGLITIAIQTKNYIQSLYSEKKTNYQQVSVLEFNI